MNACIHIYNLKNSNRNFKRMLYVNMAIEQENRELGRSPGVAKTNSDKLCMVFY